jgi:hypothetical protein
MIIENIYPKFCRASLKMMAGFQPDEISRLICLFFSSKRIEKYKSLEIEPNKGLLLSGGKGIGKTINFQILCRVVVENTSYYPKMISVKEIQSNYKSNQENGKGEQYLQTLIDTEFLVIDDLGSEETHLNDFGTKKNLIADIIYQRYILFQRGKCITYATTNLLHTHFEQIYDPRLIDRMKEMFVFQIALGESKRTNPVKVLPKKEPEQELTPYEKRTIYLEWYQSSCDNYITDIKDVAWNVMLKNHKVSDLQLDRFDVKEQAFKICEREKMKQDITKALIPDEIDVSKVSKWLLIKEIIKDVDFKTIEIL